MTSRFCAILTVKEQSLRFRNMPFYILCIYLEAENEIGLFQNETFSEIQIFYYTGDIRMTFDILSRFLDPNSRSVVLNKHIFLLAEKQI